MSAFHEWREAPAATFAVIGDPVGHSLSPRMHAAAYRALGLDHAYVAIRVPAGEVGAALDRLSMLGYRGVNVTVPHKEECLAWAKDVEPFAARARSANVIDLQRRHAANTDAPGFLDTLADLELPSGARVLMLGAGGSARALGLAMDRAGLRLSIWNRTRDKAVALVDDLGIRASVEDRIEPTMFNLVLNATSAGVKGEALGVDWSGCPPQTISYDLVYGPAAEAFLGPARAAGVRCVDGIPLLIAQGARSLSFWLGIEAPIEAMREALR